jgi:hypothetical protein
MELNAFKKVLIVGLVILIAISSYTAAILYLHITGTSTEKTAMTVADEEYLLSKLGLDSLTKEFTFSEPVLREYDQYMNVYVNESDLYSIGDGRPVLPVNLTIIELPFGTEIIDFDYECSTPKIINITKKLSYGSYSPETVMDENIYGSEETYPSYFVTYHTGGGLSDESHKTFLVIRVYPVVYVPLKDQLIFTKNVKVKITYEEPVEKLLENNDIYDLLIITPSSFSKTLQPLVDHKNSFGVKTKLATVEEVYDNGWYGRDEPEKIKYYIKIAIETWGIEYVLLVGGMKGQSKEMNIPLRCSHVVPPKEQEYQEPSFISDLYYADIYDSKGNFSSWDSNDNNIFAEWNENVKDEMDLYPDVYLGRLPCRDEFDVKTMVDKIINYEKNKVSEKDWFKKLVLVAGDSYNDKNHFIEGELITDKAIELMPEFTPVKVYASKTIINGRTINKALNQGCGFVFFCGHGGTKSWGTHYPPDGTKWTGFYEVKNIDFLINKEKLPVVVIGGCLNAKFNISQTKSIQGGIQSLGLKYFSLLPWKLGGFWTSGWIIRPQCLAEKLTIKRGGGAIATIANTGLGTHGRDDTDHNSVADYLEVLDGWLELRFLELYGEEKQDMLGMNHGQTMTEYLHRFLGNNDKMDTKMVQQWILFGDPSLKIGGYP